MSAAALRSLASAGATTLYDAIGRAETSAELDELSQQVSCGWGHGAILDDDATHLFEYINRRRCPVKRQPRRQETLPGLPLPEPNRQRVGPFAKRRTQRSPDRQASYDRRHRLAFSGVMPHHLAARLTIGDMAVMSVVAAEYRRIARCELTLDEIAARAGVCRRTARRAMAAARDQNLISVELRPVRGRKHWPNLVQIISFEWLKWLLRATTKRDQASDPIGGHLVSPTKNKTSEDDGVLRSKAFTAETSASSKGGQANKEAIEFAAELANICGYGQATVPKSWRDADPPQVVQVWLNELAGGGGRPIDVLRSLATNVMRRKRSYDASPPCSPHYFSAEVRKLVARAHASPRREPSRRVA